MVSNLLLTLLIFTNSVIAIYLLYHLYLKIKNKCKKDDVDPFNDADLYYKQLITEPNSKEMIFP
jgi:hypothetical protein